MFEALLPGLLLIGAGLAAARLGLMPPAAVKALSDLAFHLLLPALLFRSMARTDLETLDFAAPGAYFGATVPLFLAVVLWARLRGRSLSEAGVHALACTYSNLVMLGLPVARLIYGERGFALLLTVIALHSLVMLTLATLVLELDPARRGGGPAAALAGAVRTALLHPVILPIFAGLAWALAGPTLPEPVDQTLALAGGAAPTLCLLLLGASLGGFDPRVELAGAVAMAGVKNLAHPLLAWVVGRWVFELDTAALAVVVFGAAMPIGANVFLFAQRYGVAMPQVSAGVTLSTITTGVALVPLLGWLSG